MVVVGERLVYPRGHLILIQKSRRCEYGAISGVGIGQVLGKELRLRRNPVGRNDVAGERRSGSRIVDDVQARGAEIARFLRGRRHDVVEDGSGSLAHGFIIQEKEGTVFAAVKLRHRQGAADGAAELVPLEDVARQGEEVARIQFVVAQEFEKNAVHLVCAAFGSAIQHAARVPILRAVFALLDLKLLRSEYSAEYRNSGGVLNGTTKSGTNEVHGVLFEFLRCI